MENNVTLEQLRIYYKDKLLKLNEDYKISKKKEILFLKSFDKRFIKARWETIK
jgi:hypothetical protein